MDAKSQYTVLRIKRKATEAPLSSLVIQDPASDPSSRIKKRRDVSGRPRGVFRLAETVPPTWQGQGDEAEALKTRIKGLLKTKELEDEEMEMNNGLDPASKASPLVSPRPGAHAGSLNAGPSTLSPPVPSTQYRVIPPMSPRSRLMLPPKVYSHKDAQTGALVFVDAAAVEAQAREEAGRSALPEAEEEEDKEMAAFQSMLKEYLSLEKPELPVSTGVGPVETSSQSMEDGYVYDLYYRDARATPTQMSLGDGVTPNSIGALLGYEDFSPPSTPSDSEIEDEADEDSNDEDFYRNDYPEDEDADSDMQDLEDRDGGWSSDEYNDGNDDGDDEERGNWDYR